MSASLRRHFAVSHPVRDHLQDTESRRRTGPGICVTPTRPSPAPRGTNILQAIASQADACAHLFSLPLCVLAGEAGTGKTTVVEALLQAIERTEGAGASFQLLAPTGKAAERLRERTGHGQTATVHSFLTKRGWLNANMTFKRQGGQREQAITTYHHRRVVDAQPRPPGGALPGHQLELGSASHPRRGSQSAAADGRGGIFADVIDWLRSLGAVGELRVNMRQMENRALGQGTGILDLADAYRRRAPAASAEDADSTPAEDILGRVQNGGDIDRDLRVLYWNGHEDLTAQLISQVVADVEADRGVVKDDVADWEFWRAAFGDNKQPELYPGSFPVPR